MSRHVFPLRVQSEAFKSSETGNETEFKEKRSNDGKGTDLKH